MNPLFISSLTLAICSTSYGSTLLLESEAGEFSDSFLNPTPFNLMNGENTLQFTIGGDSSIMGGAPNGTGGATNGSDADFILFNIPTGSTLTSIRVIEDSAGGSHFFGAQFGTAFTQQPADDPAFGATLNGQTLFDTTLFGRELTRNFFDPGLELGATNRDFVALFQETSATPSTVTLRVTVIPEPSTAALLSFASLSLLRRKRA